MANFKDSKHFNVHNDYYTPKSAWENIQHIIPKDKKIWEACMLNSHKSKSPQYLTELGFDVVYDTSMNILESQPDEYDIIVSNPPFETKIKKEILKRLVELDKPFILLMNSLNMYSKYMREIFKDNLQHLQIINPSTKIHYGKYLDNGDMVYDKKTSFYSIYLAYKMNIPNEQLWIE